MSISQMRLVQPITLVGFTALSVESCTNRSHVVFAGAHQQIFGAQNIVLDRFCRADLHQRHMLVCCRMEHHQWDDMFQKPHPDAFYRGWSQ